MSHRMVRAVVSPRLGALALALIIAAARPVVAQQPVSPASGPILFGIVVDAGNGEPLPYAQVGVANRVNRVLTDSAGVFRLSGLAAGVYNITASQLGYAPMTLPFVVAEGGDPVEFRLFPDPIAIEGIRVMGDRFRGRRNALAVSATGYDRERLLRSSSLNIMEFLENDAHLIAAQCPGRQPIRACFSRRGQTVVPQVFLDDSPLVGGLSQLGGYNPRDLVLVEVIDQGNMVRVYTQAFMDRLARNPRSLEPIIIR